MSVEVFFEVCVGQFATGDDADVKVFVAFAIVCGVALVFNEMGEEGLGIVWELADVVEVEGTACCLGK